MPEMSNEGAYYDEKAKKGTDNVGIYICFYGIGRWTKEEHDLFLEGISRYGKEWKKIASLISTRTVVQVRTHAQKYFQRLSKLGTTTTKEVTQKQGVKRNYDGSIKGESSSATSKVDFPAQQSVQQNMSSQSQNQQSNQQSSSYHINIQNKSNKRQAISRKEPEKSPVSVCSILQEPPPFPFLQEPATAMSILQQQQQQYQQQCCQQQQQHRQQQQAAVQYQQCQFQPYHNASMYQQPPPQPTQQTYQQPLEMNEFGYYYPEPIAIIDEFALTNSWNGQNNEDYPLPSYLEEYNNGFSKYPRMTVFGDITGNSSEIEQYFM